jgi:hypothetical protein
MVLGWNTYLGQSFKPWPYSFMMLTKTVDQVNLETSAQGQKILTVMMVMITLAPSHQDGEDHQGLLWEGWYKLQGAG